MPTGTGPLFIDLPSASGTDADSFAVLPGITITDSYSGFPLVSASLAFNDGSLSGIGLTKQPDGTYALAATTLAQLSTELQSIQVTPLRGEFPLNSVAPDGLELTVTDLTNAVTSTAFVRFYVTDVQGQPSISGAANQTVVKGQASNPFASVEVVDATQNVTHTLTIDLGDGGVGSLTASGLVSLGGGRYQLSGTVFAINSALAGASYAAAAGSTETLVAATLTDVSSAGGNEIASAPASFTIDETPGLACYCAGTMIATDRGEVDVAALTAGDVVVTGSGRREPIRWVGRRSYAGRFLARHPEMLPVRIRAGALGHGLPRRDLRVSPNHALLLDGVLVPAGLLVNGASIAREPGGAEVRYVHVELDRHDILLAEGAAAESFLDDGSRGMFQNSADRPLNRTSPERAYCAQRVEAGMALHALRRRLAGRSAA